MHLFKNIVADTLQLFYPHICTGCGSDILNKENLLCITCINDLPHTSFAQHANNPIEKIFWGRIPLKAAHSEFYFSKGSLIQELVHQLKYKGNKEIGFYLGELIGKSLLNSNRFLHIDAIIPLPLFADKEFQRGYNQAAMLSHWLSARLNIPCREHWLLRTQDTPTQQALDAKARKRNLLQAFGLSPGAQVQGLHLALIDDVLTTGATAESLARLLLKAGARRVDVYCLARTPKPDGAP